MTKRLFRYKRCQISELPLPVIVLIFHSQEAVGLCWLSFSCHDSFSSFKPKPKKLCLWTAGCDSEPWFVGSAVLTYGKDIAAFQTSSRETCGIEGQTRVCLKEKVSVKIISISLSSVTCCPSPNAPFEKKCHVNQLKKREEKTLETCASAFLPPGILLN